MESGITAREYHMCDSDFTGRGATSMKGYEKVQILKLTSLSWLSLLEALFPFGEMLISVSLNLEKF
jgi:hypothetical protein